MQTVSQRWKDNHNKTIVSQGFVEVALDVTDPDALNDTTASDNGSVYISDTAEVVSADEKNIPPYATLEQNLWLLDGSRKFIPLSDFGDNGYIGELISGENCCFIGNPTLTISFSEVHDNLLPAVTIKWGTAYGEFAKDFIVTAYNGNTAVATKTVIGNTSLTSEVLVEINHYNKITIEIIKWCLPYRRPRIEEVFIGLRRVFGGSKIISYSHSMEADLITASLPKTEINFALDNSNGDYNPMNANGMSKYLLERQEITSRYGYKIGDGIEWIDGGHFWLTEWGAKQNDLKAEFSARDIIGLMGDTYYEGLYNSNGTTLYALATALLTKAQLPTKADGTNRWNIDSSLQSITTTAPLPVDTIANCLQLVVNAAGCVMYQDRKGVLQIKPIDSSLKDYGITLNNSYKNPEHEVEKPIKAIEVSAHHYSASSEATKVYDGSISINGTQEILLPFNNTVASAVATVTGGTLNSAVYYSGACKLNITASGTVNITVSGYTLDDSVSTVTTSNGAVGEVISLDNPLITSETRASAIGTWIKGVHGNRTTVEADWRCDPRLDVLDKITVKGSYQTSNVYVTDVKYNFGGAFKGKAEGRTT